MRLKIHPGRNATKPKLIHLLPPGPASSHRWRALCGVHVDGELLKKALEVDGFKRCAKCFREWAEYEKEKA